MICNVFMIPFFGMNERASKASERIWSLYAFYVLIGKGHIYHKL
jgi:hypothetical protein